MSQNIDTKSSSPNNLDNSEGQLVVFALGEEEFGVNINNVREIVRMPDLTPIPQSPDYVAGICNLRGNVLPVLDSRHRFGLDKKAVTEATRLLVVECNGNTTGLVVDEMRKVVHVNQDQIDPPPMACKGVGREFLSGVVKMDGGKRLVMVLNLVEVVEVESHTISHQKATTTQASVASPMEETVDEEQLVSFTVADEEYAFGIHKVREILRVTEITEVPNVPAYVKGLLTVRDQLIPILDLRAILGVEDMSTTLAAEIDAIIDGHQQWVCGLEKSLQDGSPFDGALDPAKCMFGQWLVKNKTLVESFEFMALKTLHADFHRAGEAALNLRQGSKDDALTMLENTIKPMEQEIVALFQGLKESLGSSIRDGQRIMVVESGALHLGFLVDSVNEVLRVGINSIDDTPWAASSERQEIKGVAKLNDGNRLIMIMDEDNLIGREESEMLNDMQQEEDKNSTDADKTLAEESEGEEQLVTFFIGEEEYGVTIMQVQEINRLEEITAVPNAPDFIDGLTNLRGNVIPVMNIRTLFNQNVREKDDRTRIVIVDIAGKKTGLRVDRVNEVLRIPKRNIEDTPAVVAGSGASRFLKGICKLDKGHRMVMLIDVERILGVDDLEAFSEMDADKKSPKNKAKVATSKAATRRTTAPARKKLKKKIKKKMRIAE